MHEKRRIVKMGGAEIGADPLACPCCGGRMQVLSIIDDPEIIREK